MLGLGNPGARFDRTRHNVGFRCIDLVSREYDIPLSEKRKEAILGIGTIDRTFIEPGEYVARGQRLLLMHNSAVIWVEANVKETDIRNVKLGAVAKISVDAYPDLVVVGEVVRIGNAATNQFALLPSPNPSGSFTKITQRLPVKIAVPQTDGLLRPGMMVEVEIAITRD